MNIGILIIAIVGGATGLLSTAYLAISFPAVLLWSSIAGWSTEFLSPNKLTTNTFPLKRTRKLSPGSLVAFSYSIFIPVPDPSSHPPVSQLL